VAKAKLKPLVMEGEVMKMPEYLMKEDVVIAAVSCREEIR
jgi:hypothetical protein